MWETSLLNTEVINSPLLFTQRNNHKIILLELVTAWEILQFHQPPNERHSLFPSSAPSPLPSNYCVNTSSINKGTRAHSWLLQTALIAKKKFQLLYYFLSLFLVLSFWANMSTSPSSLWQCFKRVDGHDIPWEVFFLQEPSLGILIFSCLSVCLLVVSTPLNTGWVAKVLVKAPHRTVYWALGSCLPYASGP